jgi:hypothetical protein
MGSALAQVLIASLSSTTVKDMISAGFKSLMERAKSAEETYQVTHADRKDPVEERRAECIHRIAQVRNRAALCIQDPGLQQKIWCLLMEQTIGVYEAVSTTDLDFVNTPAASTSRCCG